MSFSQHFRLVNLAVAGFMLLGAFTEFFSSHGSIILGVYITLFALATGGLEFQIPPQAQRYGSFMFSFIGRGFFYTLVAAILLTTNTFGAIAAWTIGLIGLAYMALEFVPSMEPPASMRDPEIGGSGVAWGGVEGV